MSRGRFLLVVVGFLVANAVALWIGQGIATESAVIGDLSQLAECLGVEPRAGVYHVSDILIELARLAGVDCLPGETASAGEEPEWIQQASYTGDATKRPAGTVVISFSDGYKWLIRDSILGRLCDGEPQQGSSCNGTIQGIEGTQAFYYHKLGTNLVCVVPK